MGLCQKERRIDCWFQLCFVILAHLEWFRVYDMLLCDLNPPLSRKGWIWWRPPQEWWGVAGFYWSFQHGSCVSPTGQMGHQIIFQGWEKYISQIISPLILVEYHLDLCSGKKRIYRDEFSRWPRHFSMDFPAPRGRLTDFIDRGVITMSNVGFLVLDEVNEGFHRCWTGAHLGHVHQIPTHMLGVFIAIWWVSVGGKSLLLEAFGAYSWCRRCRNDLHWRSSKESCIESRSWSSARSTRSESLCTGSFCCRRNGVLVRILGDLVEQICPSDIGWEHLWDWSTVDSLLDPKTSRIGILLALVTNRHDPFAFQKRLDC